MSFLSKLAKGVKGVFNVLTLGVPRYLSRKLKEWMNPNIDKEGFKTTRYGSDNSVPVVYGRAKIEPIVAERNVTDKSGGAKNDTMHILCIFCHGEIDAFEKIYFNNVISTDDRWKKNGNPMFTITEFLGSDTQTIPEGVGKLLNFTTSTSHYRGLAGLLVSFTQDKDLSVWRGEPKISAIVRGKKCYDFRTDTTAWTENGAIHLIDYIKSDVYGRSTTDDEINYGTFRSVADKCDVANIGNTVTETITEWLPFERRHSVSTVTSTETFKRFTHNNIIDTSQSIFNNMKEIANSFRGYFPDGDGRISIGSEDEQTPVMQINESHIVSTVSTTSPKRRDFFNRATVRFPNIKNDFEKDEVTWPELDDPLYIQWLEEDFGKERRETVTIESCVYKSEALQFAELIVKLSRTLNQAEFTGVAELIQLEIGDVIGFSYAQLGYVEETFSVADMTPREDFLVDITLVRHNNSAYPWTQLTYDENLGGDFPGDLTDIDSPTSVTYVEDTTGATGGTVTVVPDDNVQISSHIVEIFNEGNLVTSFSVGLSTSIAIPKLPPDDYLIKVYSRSVGGFLSTTSTDSAITVPVPTDVTDIITGDYVLSLPSPFVDLSLGQSLELLDTQIEGVSTQVDELNTELSEFVSNSSSRETQRRLESDARLLQVQTSAAAYRQELLSRNSKNERLIDAVVTIDPNTGTIINRAFQYSDNQFTEAQLLIDGVNSEIGLLVSRTTINEGDIQSINSELNLLPGEISAIATTVVAESIAALEPAHSFNFFDSAQGWMAIRGAITQGLSQISVTHGDLQNASLNYLAQDNPLIRITISRTGGSGWTGDIIINGTDTYSAFIEEPSWASEAVIKIDFRGISGYTGSVSTVRLILGSSVADIFTIKSITIGKPESSSEELANLSARVAQAELDIDSNEGQILQRVTVTDYNANTVTLSNAETVVDGLDSIISLQAFKTSVDNQGTIAKANSADVFIDGSTSTITQIVTGLDNDISANTSQLSAVQQQVNDFAITDQIVAGKLNRVSTIESSVDFLSQVATRGIKDFNQSSDVSSLVLAVSRISVDLSDKGVTGKRIFSLEALLNTTVGTLNGAVQELNTVSLGVDGNASVLSTLELTVENIDSSLSSTISRVSQVELDAENNASAINSIGAQVSNPLTGLSATFGVASAANTTANEANNRSGVNASSITALTNRVSDTESNITANSNLIQEVKLDTEGNATSITNISNAVGIVDIRATAALELSAGIDASLGEYRSTAQLSVDNSGNLGFIQLDGTPSNTTFRIKTDQTEFLDNNNNPFIVFDGENNTASFLGKLFAQNIEGDVTDAIVKVTTARRWTGASNDPPRIAEVARVTVAAMPFARFVTCGRLEYSKIGIQDPVVRFSGIVSKTTETIAFVSNPSIRHSFTLSPPVAVIPAGASGDLIISVGEQFTFDDDYACPSQELIISTFKQGKLFKLTTKTQE